MISIGFENLSKSKLFALTLTSVDPWINDSSVMDATIPVPETDWLDPR